MILVYIMGTMIQIFKNEMFGEIRTMTNERGETFFVGKDVAEALGYNQTDKAITRHVDEDDRTKHTVVDSKGRKQPTFIINESGLYALILSSKLDQAKAFKRWVTSEVLPAIRKTGRYELSSAELKLLGEKAEYCDQVLLSVDCMTTTQVANELGMSWQELYRKLIAWGIVYWQSGEYLLYSDYARMGLAKTRTHSRRNRLGIRHTHSYPVWTERGRQFIHGKYEQEQAIGKKLDSWEVC